MKHPVKWLWFNLAARALTVIPQKIPTLLTGAGSLKLVPSELKVHNARKPLIVTDASLVKSGVVGGLAAVLSGAGFSFAVFDGVLPDPPYEVCERGLELLRAEGCDSVISIGGGSAIDAGKLVRMAATHRKSVDKFAGLLPCRNGGLPFICVPTTAGSGSEATAAAVITDAKRHRKITVLDPRLPPDTAILDPAVTVSLPPAITAATGLDALTHAVEAYTNTLRYSDVDVQAIEATRLIFSNLRAAFSDGGDLQAREAMLRAAHLAGRAFTRGFVGYVHAVAHRFGERYGVPHGMANAIALPYFLDLYCGVCPARLAELAAAAGLHGRDTIGDPEASARAFAAAVRSLAADCGIPEKAAFLKMEDVPGIAADALREARRTPYPVPIVLDAAALEGILNSMRAE